MVKDVKKEKDCSYKLKYVFNLTLNEAKVQSSGPYLGFFVCGGKLRLRGQTPQTFTGISRIQTGFLVKRYVREKN